MSTHRLLKKSLSFFASIALTATWFAYDTLTAENRRVEALLQWSHQVTQQVEALRLYAREKNESDPISWAVKYLMVGDETRPLWIKPYYDSHASSHPENFSLEPRKGEFYYSKVLNFENGQGIQLLVHSDPIGFLGSRSIWLNDFLVFLIFLMIYGSLLALLTLNETSTAEEIARLEKLSGHEEEWLDEILHPHPTAIPTPAPTATPVLEPVPVVPAAPEMPAEPAALSEVSHWKGLVSEWIRDAKKTLVNLGLAIKSMTQEAKNLIEIVAKSKVELIKSVETLKALNKAVEDLELISLQPTDNIEHLREVTATLKDLGERTSSQMDKMLTEYNAAFEVTRKLNDSITRTNGTVLDEAKMIQTLKAKI